jgi:hypothetical protein
MKILAGIPMQSSSQVTFELYRGVRAKFPLCKDFSSLWEKLLDYGPTWAHIEL